jgi:predicted RNase H-like HicB family nuclease
MKKEFAFQIEQDEDMLVATCPEPKMATQGENLDELLAMIRDLIRCRFDDGDERLAWPIRLHFLNDPSQHQTENPAIHSQTGFHLRRRFDRESLILVNLWRPLLIPNL